MPKMTEEEQGLGYCYKCERVNPIYQLYYGKQCNHGSFDLLVDAVKKNLQSYSTYNKWSNSKEQSGFRSTK